MAPIKQYSKRKIKNRPEQDLQKTCVRWFKIQYPNELLIHIPNGGKRNAREAEQFKKMGTKAGFPDLALFKKKGDYGALFIEMKAEKGSISDKQENVLASLQKLGYKVEIVNSFEKFTTVINEYLRKEF